MSPYRWRVAEAAAALVDGEGARRVISHVESL
jgi:hypothetical protein